jgi:hypothetical protein
MKLSASTLIERISTEARRDAAKAYKLLEDDCNRIPVSEWRKYEFTDFNAAMAVFVTLVKSGHCDDAPDSPLRELYLNVTQYLLDNAPPELRKIIENGTQDQGDMLCSGDIPLPGRMLYS